MKQHITPDQFKELSTTARTKLQDWWTPQWGDIYLEIHSAIPDDENVVAPPNGDECYHYDLSTSLYRPDDGCVTAGSVDRGVCDALWEAVKEVLSKEEEGGE